MKIVNTGSMTALAWINSVLEHWDRLSPGTHATALLVQTLEDCVAYHVVRSTPLPKISVHADGLALGWRDGSFLSFDPDGNSLAAFLAGSQAPAVKTKPSLADARKAAARLLDSLPPRSTP